ncbi:high-affinity nickel-transport protein [Aureococcus anophagefferens]|nr:high-affinity nickel-transport protein [Aureococcus anophagefferens]
MDRLRSSSLSISEPGTPPSSPLSTMGRKTTIASPFAMYAVRLTLGAIVAINVALVAALLSLGARYPALVSPGLLALGFGLRRGGLRPHRGHRQRRAARLAGLGRPAALVGLWFSLGHSTMVVGLCGVVAGGSACVATTSALTAAGAAVSAAFSAVMLSTLGVVNLASIGPQFREWRRARGEAGHGHGSGATTGCGCGAASPCSAGDGEDRAGALLFGLLLTAASASVSLAVGTIVGLGLAAPALPPALRGPSPPSAKGSTKTRRSAASSSSASSSSRSSSPSSRRGAAARRAATYASIV